ncbi:hypothetical protein B0H17DRAFT_1178017 [Mycena rosella]|uniref:Uncharacterized protein n=1 Tax=Mycena rosella TaxID=1033263 RepID=A0AAD7GMM4_MYCRO|nr:hypothetical protein B0H17DRAFT_1178017 [Mycena rosella]
MLQAYGVGRTRRLDKRGGDGRGGWFPTVPAVPAVRAVRVSRSSDGSFDLQWIMGQIRGARSPATLVVRLSSRLLAMAEVTLGCKPGLLAHFLLHPHDHSPFPPSLACKPARMGGRWWWFRIKKPPRRVEYQVTNITTSLQSICLRHRVAVGTDQQVKRDVEMPEIWSRDQFGANLARGIESACADADSEVKREAKQDARRLVASTGINWSSVSAQKYRVGVGADKARRRAADQN